MTTKQTKTLAEALAAAQAQMSNAQKNAKNPHFKTNYADLSAVRDVVLPAMNENGIAVVQHVDGSDGSCTVRTVLYYGSESLEAGNCTLRIDGRNAPQAVGSITTYLRRYQLAAVGGIAQADDDAQSVPAQRQQRQQRQPAPARPGPKASVGPCPCPMCGGKTWDNRAYRAWHKENPAEKKRPALACNDWRECKWTIWPTGEAESFLKAGTAETNSEGFEDGL